jgi:antibiotic biosynthesis monooxygenase (ABM) superfamily enzyme
MEQPSHPKKWKFALLVWCFIYPVITLLSALLIPLMVDFAMPLRTLVLSLILVSIMAFFYIPFINKRFYTWLRK